MNGTILLADDSLTIQKVVELTFADTDHAVVTVSSGDELLEKLPSVQPDLVICDVLMPGTDGYTVCQNIKSDPRWLHIPVVLLTGTFEPFDRDRAIAAGCNEIITKPFEARKLVETVENLLQQGAPPTEEPVSHAERFEGAVAPPAFGEPVSEAGDGEPYGTVLASAPEGAGRFPADVGNVLLEEPAGEGLDFTTTGFDKMRAAGEIPETFPETPPDEGLEFDVAPSSGESMVDEPFQADQAPEDPFSTPEDAQVHQTFPPVPEDTFEFGQPTEGFPAGGEEPTLETPPAILDRPATLPMEIPEELRPRSEPAEPAFGELSEDTTLTPEETTEQEEAPEEGPVGPSETDAAGEITPKEDFDSPDTAPVAPPESGEHEDESVPGAPAESASPVPSPPLVGAGEAPAPAGTLSDEDVERIARRVVELAADQLEQIAWEVIPDMAELVVRERIRELEAEADQEDTTH